MEQRFKRRNKMKKITLLKNGIAYEFKSLNEAVRENGAKSGMNSQVATRFLEKQGFDVSSIKIETTTRENSIIDRLEKMSAQVDKELVAKLEQELADVVRTLKLNAGTSALDKIVELNEKIELAKNPSASLDAILELVKKLYLDKHA
jgi:HPt (histidine-containing phosphotransfer) domain-containing protein